MRRPHLLLCGLILTAAACSSGSDDAVPGAAATGSTSGETAVEAGATEPPAIEIDEAVVVEPGTLVDGTLTIDGDQVDYVTITPEGFEVGDTAPVLLAFPPGGQDLETTRSVAQETYLTQAVERGWVVFSPASPVDGDRWFEESAELVPSMLDWIDTWVAPEGGTVHVAGVSNGGLSTFAAAAIAPDRVQSLLTFPGFPRGDEARDALPELVDVPIRMFVGELDDGWVEPMQSAADTLDELGGDVTLEIVANSGHIIGELRDGERIFDELDAVRPG